MAFIGPMHHDKLNISYLLELNYVQLNLYHV